MMPQLPDLPDFGKDIIPKIFRIIRFTSIISSITEYRARRRSRILLGRCGDTDHIISQYDSRCDARDKSL